MNKEKASLVSEAALWDLYRKLLGGRLLEQHVSALPRKRASSVGIAVAAALAENLQVGDTLGLAPADATTRYLCGMPLQALRDAAKPRPRPRKAADGSHVPTWALEADAAHGILPATGALQAGLAAGTAIAARLHGTGSVTVLMQSLSAKETANSATALRTPLPEWAEAAGSAAALQLPMLFITDSHLSLQHETQNPRTPASPLPAIPVDRRDALALYRVIYESTARARSGGGPTWIDAHDWMPQTAGKQAGAQAKTPGFDPVTLLEQALRSRQLFDRERHRHLERGLVREFARAGWTGLDPA